MNYIEDDKNFIANTYKRNEVILESGKGATIYSQDKKRYIDFTSGIGVNSLGFSNNYWMYAVVNQITKMQHCSNLYYSMPQVELAKKLCEATGYKKVFFSNSGAEANECAIKLARKYSFDKYGSNRFVILTLDNSFHGRTMAALTATGQDEYHKYFSPFLEGIRHMSISDEIEKHLADDVCAVMIEVVQGEGGVVCVSKAFMEKLQTLCSKKDILLIVDEVQTGVGRTGKFLASDYYNIKPDIITLAKGLGGGLPIGACLMNEKTKDVLVYSSHGSTFGGNPAVCAGANIIVEKINSEEFLKEVLSKSNYIKDQINKMKNVASVNGLGLMIGIELKDKEASEVVKACLDKGLLILTAKKKLRLLPPLNINMDEINEGLAILKEVLESE